MPCPPRFMRGRHPLVQFIIDHVDETITHEQANRISELFKGGRMIRLPSLVQTEHPPFVPDHHNTSHDEPTPLHQPHPESDQ